MTFEENEVQIEYLEKEFEGLALRKSDLEKKVEELQGKGKVFEERDAILEAIDVGERLGNVQREYVAALVRGLELAREEREELMSRIGAAKRRV